MFTRNMKKIILLYIGLALVIAIAGFSYGYLLQLAKAEPPEDAERTGTDASDGFDPDGTMSAQTAGNTAESILVLQRYYTSCGHTLYDEMKINTANAGTGQELGLSFPAWRLVEFSPGKAVLAAEVNGYCPNHYIIKEDNGFLTVYSSGKETGELYPVEQTTIRYERLGSELQELIKDGLAVDTIEEIELLIEDMES